MYLCYTLMYYRKNYPADLELHSFVVSLLSLLCSHSKVERHHSLSACKVGHVASKKYYMNLKSHEECDRKGKEHACGNKYVCLIVVLFGAEREACAEKE